MSRRQDIQEATGRVEFLSGYGHLQRWGAGAPTQGETGNAKGCTYQDVSNAKVYVNIGTNTSAVWVEDDGSAAAGNAFGTSKNPSTGAAFMLGSGNIYRTALKVANGISPNATGVLNIVDFYTLPANSFDVIGRVLQISIYCNNTGTSGHAVRIQVVANATNTGMPANPTTFNGTNAGVSGKTDGTVTVTGGTAVLDTGASYSPTGTVTFGIQMMGQIISSGTNAQEATVTDVFPSAGLTHTAAWIDLNLTQASANTFAICVSAVTATTDIVYQGCMFTAFN